MELNHVIAVVLTLAATVMMQWRYGLFTITKLNVLQVMFLSHVAAQLIPSFIIGMDPGNWAGSTYLLYCAICTLLIPFGGMFADALCLGKANTHYYRIPIANDLVTRKRFANFFLAYLTFCILVFFSYVIRVPSIPVFDLFFTSVNVGDHQLERREANTLGLLFGISVRFFMPVLFIIGIISSRYFVNFTLRSAGIVSILVAMSYNAWPGSKTPVATLFLLALIIVLLRYSEEINEPVRQEREISLKLQRKSKKRKRRLAMIMLFLVVLYPAAIYMFLPAGQLGIEYVLVSIFLRIFFNPANNTYAAFEMFSNGGYTYFADIRKLASLFEMQYISLSTKVAVYRGFTTFTNAPPSAIGTFYAQGGGFFVILGVIMASAVFKLTENILRQATAKTPLTVALYALLIFAAFRFSWANFHSMIMSEVFGPMVIIWVMWKFFGRTAFQLARAPEKHSL